MMLTSSKLFLMFPTNESQQDKLYHWKKHSGFKKGSRTDIVLGDNGVGHISTMARDYQTHAPRMQKAAGQALGFDTSDRSINNLQLGDSKLENFKRLVPFEPEAGGIIVSNSKAARGS